MSDSLVKPSLTGFAFCLCRYLFNVRGPRGLGSRRGSSRTRVHFHSINTATQPPASDHGALDDSLVHGLVPDLVHDLDGNRAHLLLKETGGTLLHAEPLTAVTLATEQ